MASAAGDGDGRGRAVLVGVGHAHLHVLKHARAFRRRGFELVAVAPGPFWYSGLATGMLGGMYAPEDDRVDIAALADRAGARLVVDRAVGLDARSRRVLLESGPPLAYEAVSLNLGSVVPVDAVPGLAGRAVPVKPIGNLAGLRRDLEGRLAASQADRPVRLLVLGGGPTGCEVAFNAARLVEAAGGAAEVTLLTAGRRLLDGTPEPVPDRVAHRLRLLGVRVVTASAVDRVEPGEAVTAGGRRVPFDVLVAAIGLVPPPLVGEFGLPVDDAGALRVDAHLRSVADPAVFGGGDCIAPEGLDLPRLGVHAVRQAPILLANLLSALRGRPPRRRYRPRRHHLWIMNLGDGTGLAFWGPFHWHGPLAFRLKDWLDRRFLDRYR